MGRAMRKSAAKLTRIAVKCFRTNVTCILDSPDKQVNICDIDLVQLEFQIRNSFISPIFLIQIEGLLLRVRTLFHLFRKVSTEMEVFLN
jgi:hypothetical protein